MGKKKAAKQPAAEAAAEAAATKKAQKTRKRAASEASAAAEAEEEAKEAKKAKKRATSKETATFVMPDGKPSRPLKSERLRLRPDGCSRCRNTPGCSPSCWHQSVSVAKPRGPYSKSRGSD